jgi:hypothetical protein
LAASIDHPHVVPIYEAGEADGLLYIVMRYVNGPDLGALIAEERRLSPARAAQIVAQVAAALDAAHGKGLVHRDVKPANVLLAGEGGEEHAYLTDFGLTKRTSSQSGLTGTGVFVGTVDYVAPEQVRGERLDARADVYALGCLLFHALTGEVPYPREDDMAKMYAHAQLGAPSPSELVPGLPRQFDAVVARAMAKERVGRYPSAGDLGRAGRAAAERQVATVPERSVAAGAAALMAGDDGDAATRRATVRPTRAPRERLRKGVAGAKPRTVHRSKRRLRLVGAVLAAAIVGLGAAAGVLAIGSGRADPKPGGMAEVDSESIQIGDTREDVELSMGQGFQPGHGAGCIYNPGPDQVFVLYKYGPSGGGTTPSELPTCPDVPPDAVVTDIGSDPESPQPSTQPSTASPPPSEPLSAKSPVTTQGVGPVLAGMTVEEAEEEGQTSLVEDDAASCSYVSPTGLSGVSFMVVDGEIARTDVTEPTVATQSGIRVGASVEAVREAYGDQIEEEEGIYENTLLTFVPEDPSDETRVVFDTDGFRVTGMQAGRLPEVEAPEGCL